MSAKALARTIVHESALARRCSSAAHFIRNSSIGWSGEAPTTETRITSAGGTAAAAASIRLRLPSRSTLSGVTLPEPANPWTAEMLREGVDPDYDVLAIRRGVRSYKEK